MSTDLIHEQTTSSTFIYLSSSTGWPIRIAAVVTIVSFITSHSIHSYHRIIVERSCSRSSSSGPFGCLCLPSLPPPFRFQSFFAVSVPPDHSSLTSFNQVHTNNVTRLSTAVIDSTSFFVLIHYGNHITPSVRDPNSPHPCTRHLRMISLGFQEPLCSSLDISQNIYLRSLPLWADMEQQQITLLDELAQCLPSFLPPP